jgi:hypothetical protein
VQRDRPVQDREALADAVLTRFDRRDHEHDVGPAKLERVELEGATVGSDLDPLRPLDGRTDLPQLEPHDPLVAATRLEVRVQPRSRVLDVGPHEPPDGTPGRAVGPFEPQVPPGRVLDRRPIRTHGTMLAAFGSVGQQRSVGDAEDHPGADGV